MCTAKPLVPLEPQLIEKTTALTFATPQSKSFAYATYDLMYTQAVAENELLVHDTLIVLICAELPFK